MLSSKTTSNKRLKPVQIKDLYDVDMATFTRVLSHIGLYFLVKLYRGLATSEKFDGSNLQGCIKTYLEAYHNDNLKKEQDFFAANPQSKPKKIRHSAGILSDAMFVPGETIYGTRQEHGVIGATIIRKGEGYDDNIIPVLCVDNTKVKVRTGLQRADDGNRLCETVF